MNDEIIMNEEKKRKIAFRLFYLMVAQFLIAGFCIGFTVNDQLRGMFSLLSFSLGIVGIISCIIILFSMIHLKMIYLKKK